MISHKSSSVSFSDSRRIVSENLHLKLESEAVSLGNSLGRIAAEDVFSGMDNPPFNRATMDGYALKSIDSVSATSEKPLKLRITGEIMIGDDPSLEITSGTAARISTGCKLPAGADCVAMVEKTRSDGNTVEILYSLLPGENVAIKGNDVSRGELILSSGTTIEPPHISVLSALGISRLNVRRRIRIGIISTGNELIEPDVPYMEGRIYDSNSRSIAALLEGYRNIEIEILGIVPDRWDSIENAMKKALLRNDIVIVSGGSSAGDHDYVYRIMDRMKPGLLFHGVYVKPGMPTAFAMSGDRYLIGLPGFPVSAMMVFMSIFLESILRNSGDEHITENVKFRLGSSVKRLEREKMNLIPVKILGNDTDMMAYPVLGLSGSISRFLDTDGYAIIPGELGSCKTGDEIEVKLFRKLRERKPERIAGHFDSETMNFLSMTGLNSPVTRMSSSEALEAFKNRSVRGAVVDMELTFLEHIRNTEWIRESRIDEIYRKALYRYTFNNGKAKNGISGRIIIIGDDFNPGDLIDDGSDKADLMRYLSECKAYRVSIAEFNLSGRKEEYLQIYTTNPDLSGSKGEKILEYARVLIIRNK